MNKLVIFAVLAIGIFMYTNGSFGGKKSGIQLSSQKSSGNSLSGFAKSSGSAIGSAVENSGNFSN